jgi:hypothetical protein
MIPPVFFIFYFCGRAIQKHFFFPAQTECLFDVTVFFFSSTIYIGPLASQITIANSFQYLVILPVNSSRFENSKVL